MSAAPDAKGLAYLIEQHGAPIEVETIDCVTSQGNFPYNRNRPWVSDDGSCSICHAQVEHERLRPPESRGYTCIAMPHSRPRHWFKVDGDTLDWMHDYISRW